MRVLALFFLLAASVWAEEVHPLKTAAVPAAARSRAAAGSSFYRLHQLKELFASSRSGWSLLHLQSDGSYRVLASGKRNSLAGAGVLNFDWFKRPHGAGFVLYQEDGLDLKVMVFPKGTRGQAVHAGLNTNGSFSSIGGLTPTVGYDEHGTFCLEEWSSPAEGEGSMTERHYWNGHGFKPR